MRRAIAMMIGRIVVAVALWHGVHADVVWAVGTGGGWPWDDPLDKFTLGLTGWPAYAMLVTGIVLTGITWAHSHHGVGVMRGTATIAGGALAVKAIDAAGVLGFAGALF